MSVGEARLWTAAAVLALLVLGLGYHAMREPAPEFAGIGPEKVERGPLAAVLLTRTGYAPVLCAVGVAAGAFALARHASLVPFAAVVAVQLLSQSAALLLKRVFHRARPSRQRFRREAGYSYPSGHATTAVVFYGGLLLLADASAYAAPVKVLAAALLVPWIVGICWSRLALRAHHPSDVLGGTLLGASFLCAGVALLGRGPGVQGFAAVSMSVSQRSTALARATSAASSSDCSAATPSGSA